MVDIIDAPETLSQLLSGGGRWDTGIIAKPTQIKAIYGVWTKLPIPGVYVYQITDNPDFASYGAAERQDRDTRLTVDIRALNRQQMKLLEKACLDIIQTYRNIIGGITIATVDSVTYTNPYNRLYEHTDGVKDHSNRKTHSHRETFDVYLQTIGIILPNP